MKKFTILLLLITITTFVCKFQVDAFKVNNDRATVNKLIDNWHLAASKASFEEYFSYMSEDAVYIGTDPTENWNREEFKAFCKPYFDKGKAWSFTSFDRHIFFNKDFTMCWFDELLKTQMKICRGSGVLRKEQGKWKIAHYVLSMTIPNENTKEVVKLKTVFEDSVMNSYEIK